MSTEYRGLILEHGFVPQLSSLGVKGLGLEISDFKFGVREQKRL